MDAILVVDDNPIGLRIAVTLLRRIYKKHNLKLELDQATTAKEALHLMEQIQYDFILLDNQLPDGNGICLAKAARSIHLNQKAIIISVTAYEPLRSSDFDHYMDKPIQLADLEEIILKHSNQKQSQHSSDDNLAVDY